MPLHLRWGCWWVGGGGGGGGGGVGGRGADLFSIQL